MIKTPHKVDLPLPKRGVSDPDALAAEIMEKLTYSIGKDAKVATPHDWLTATILVVRDRIIDTWMESTRNTYMNNGKRVYYLSLEFLIGRLLRAQPAPGFSACAVEAAPAPRPYFPGRAARCGTRRHPRAGAEGDRRGF